MPGRPNIEKFEGAAEKMLKINLEKIDKPTRKRLDNLGKIFNQAISNIENPKQGLKFQVKGVEVKIAKKGNDKIRLELKQGKNYQVVDFLGVLGMIANYESRLNPGKPDQLLKFVKSKDFKSLFIKEFSKNKKQPKSKAPKRK